jgi:hypothetical protein
MYAMIRFLDPWIRPVWASFGLRNVVELRVAGRRSGAQRRVLLTLLRDEEQWFLGHPNGDVSWTRNLESAGTADIAFPRSSSLAIRAHRLDPAEPGDASLRDRAIGSTGQHPFPGNVVYRLARAHIRAEGVYFAVRPADVG